MHKHTLNIVTLGCSKNRVDSEKLLKQAENSGYRVLHDREEADSDIVIINTCGFINDAKEESIDTILRFSQARERGEIGKLYVMGCLSERYRDDLRSEIPVVDSWFGVNDPAAIMRSLGGEYRDKLYSERIITTPGHYAYLKVSEGCNRTCAFCAIPGIRGKYISSSIDDLADESTALAAAGVKELIIIAQDLSYYGIDLYGRQMLLPLLERLSAIEGIRWIRLHYLYPTNFPENLIEYIRDNPKICPYIDLPVQHISDKVLKMMRRSHSGTETRRLLEKIRKELPGAAIRTTLITGHPGEGEKEYRELKEFVREFRFNRLGVFTYSHEEDTYGYLNYSDSVSNRLKRSRADEIMTIQQQISEELNGEIKGLETDVIIDRKEGIWMVGRTRHDSPEVDQEVLIPLAGSSISPGDIIRVKITGSTEFDLLGKRVSLKSAGIPK
ncbi:MAG: 30S ribosomal protein S12 methylthiotransferase RimO [Bacteroidales bacterium]|nr:30S ribosomal protein S12 methylthiotransferase RimO [Bacteroidales bacterium]